MRLLPFLLSLILLSGTASASDIFMRPGDHAANARKTMRKYENGGNVRPMNMDSNGIIHRMNTCPLFFPGILPERQDPAPLCLKPGPDLHDSIEKRLAHLAKARLAERSVSKQAPMRFGKASASATSSRKETPGSVRKIIR